MCHNKEKREIQTKINAGMFKDEKFMKNIESVIKVQRAFRINFSVGRHCTVPNQKTIMRWVRLGRHNKCRTKDVPRSPHLTFWGCPLAS